ncbi:hypothetical protein T01_1263 [Trichinella spiralis]|uniref:Uncharacterized protein n=1 Tax=Trichinella spiralis TaxID=6334 RepID=A0A0V1BJ38_TRISP|nr:hypothetical protein T01_1263 [Trichinella spiralis]
MVGKVTDFLTDKNDHGFQIQLSHKVNFQFSGTVALRLLQGKILPQLDCLLLSHFVGQKRL